MTGRRCYAIEINPAYIDVAVQRWQTFAKAEATLAEDGRTFAEIAKARRKAPRSPKPEVATKQPKKPKAASAASRGHPGCPPKPAEAAE